MISYERLRAIQKFATETWSEFDQANDGSIGEGRAIVDGALVIYDLVNPPTWMNAILDVRDENGNTPGQVWTPAPMGCTGVMFFIQNDLA